MMWSRFRMAWTSLGHQHPALKHTAASLIWLPTAIVFTQHFYTLKLVSGRSMQPTLNPNGASYRDMVVVDRISVLAGKYKRGDIVTIWSPIKPAQLLVKRLIALEGDTVKTLHPYPDSTVVIPEGHVWVEGDERFHSDDSNLFGPVPRGLLDSKLVFIVWPFDRVGAIHPASLSKSSGPYGPAWRRDMAALERENWRRSRVTVAPL